MSWDEDTGPPAGSTGGPDRLRGSPSWCYYTYEHPRFGLLRGTAEQINAELAVCEATEAEQADLSVPYNANLVLGPEEQTNGHALFPCSRPIMARARFDEYVRMWQAEIARGTRPACLAFAVRAELEFCDHWTGDDIVALHALPWPIEVIIAIAAAACRRKQESVRYVNFVAEWIARKYAALNGGAAI